MDPKFEQLARDLTDAWRNGTTIPLPTADNAPRSRADAYAIQDRIAEIYGGKIAGWKVGATVKAVQVFEGHDGPVPGRIFSDRLFESPANVPSKLVRGAKVECEFAFRLTADLSPSDNPIDPEALASILTFHPAIEVAGNRYAPGTGNRAATTFDGIADNGSGGAAVLGPAIADWRKLPFETMEIDSRIDGSPPLQAYSGVYRRDPLIVTAETFTELQARKVPLPRGTCLLTGSLTLPTIIRPGQTFVARFGDVATVTMTFTP